MNSPSYSSSKRGGQSGNPNVVFVFLGVLVLFVALVVYVWTKDPVSGTLLAQLPPAAISADNKPVVDETVTQVKTNPDGEALLDEVLAKPLDTKAVDSAAAVQKPADQQLVPANGSIDSAQGAMPTEVEETKVKPQFSGQKDYEYTLKAGETLYGIASKFKAPAATLRETNNLADNNLQVGQILKIKIQGIHTVNASEGLSAIARTYGITVSDLRKANGLTSDQIQAGQTLVVPVR